METIDLQKERLNGYLANLKECAKNDSDFYLEHNEVYELYNYIIDLHDKIKTLTKQVNYLRSGEYLKQVIWERDFNEQLNIDLSEQIDALEKRINELKENKND